MKSQKHNGIKRFRCLAHLMAKNKNMSLKVDLKDYYEDNDNSSLKSLFNYFKESQFFSDSWEKQVIHFKNDNTNFNSNNETFTNKTFLAILKEQSINNISTNFNIVKYENNQRISHPIMNDSNINTHIPTCMYKQVKKAFQDNYTIQFFQPQRYSNHIHEIISLFENTFGTLCGSSAYMTPPRAQG